MMLRFKTMRLPILAKDLLERASRRRTYVFRFVYGLSLFIVAGLLFYGNIGVSAGAGESLGRGANQFAWLMSLQLGVLYVLVPIITAESVAGEKQRDTLALLLVTTLTSRQIVLQKFAARTSSMLSFVCLSFPLLAITYTFGGVTTAQLVFGVLGLIIACLQLGAFGILCSAYYQTTAQALAATYVGFLALSLVRFWFTGSTGLFEPHGVAGVIFDAVTIYCCLAVASQVLFNRAFLQSRNYLLEFFRWLDGVFEQMNVLTGGVVLVRDHGFLPKRAPIRWRETRKKSLGTFRYLFRVLVSLEFPILFCIQLIRFSSASQRGEDGGLTVLLDILWIASTALVAVHAASLVSEERSRQTLSVLLTTPLPSKRILSEKLSGVRRLIAVLMVPFATIVLFEKWWYLGCPVDYVILSGLLVVTYLTAIQWTALAVGLRFPNQLTAIVGAVGIVTIWVGGLASAGPLLRYLNIEGGVWSSLVLALSPIDMIDAVRASALYGFSLGGRPSPWQHAPAATVFHIVFYLGLAAGLQWWCRREADRYLGRIPQPRLPIAETVEELALTATPRLPSGPLANAM
jgi:ABC-type transport system involved in multi-copper enzyme maturation permease subunit